MKTETIRSLLNFKHMAWPMFGLIPACLLLIVFGLVGWRLLSLVTWEIGLFGVGLYYTAAFLVMYEHDSGIFDGDNLPYLTEAAFGITALGGAIVTLILFLVEG